MNPVMNEQGIVYMPEVSTPYSGFASKEAREVFIETRLRPPPHRTGAGGNDIEKIRQLADQHESQPALDRALALYPVTIEEAVIGGVKAEIVTPAGGVSAENRHRILINLHGGGFNIGAHARALVEAVPIGSVGKIKVVTLDYRMAPEYVFPASSEDIAAVYRVLLNDYRPENIGIYGCSAGGTLSAEAVAWFQKENLPCPGAIAMLSANAVRGVTGDSTSLRNVLDLVGSASPKITGYFDGADPNDPLVSPGSSPQVLAKFPPTVLITGSRDRFLSHSAYMHIQLEMAGVEAKLCVWDGLWHGFTWVTDLTESREAFDIVTRFFARHLGMKAVG
jgi:monoterpene epsilon-lactone hydrolase